MDQATKGACNSFISAWTSIGTPTSEEPNIAETFLVQSQLSQVSADIAEYEGSSYYTDAEDLDTYDSFATMMSFGKLPAGFFPSLPLPLLILIVTLSMGALGSTLFMLQLILSEPLAKDDYRTSVAWHIFRPFQGMAAALAIYLVVRAAQATLTPPSSANLTPADLNVFILGLLGVISGLLSDSAMEKLKMAGLDLLRTSTERKDEVELSSNVAPRPNNMDEVPLAIPSLDDPRSIPSNRHTESHDAPERGTIAPDTPASATGEDGLPSTQSAVDAIHPKEVEFEPAPDVGGIETKTRNTQSEFPAHSDRQSNEKPTSATEPGTAVDVGNHLEISPGAFQGEQIPIEPPAPPSGPPLHARRRKGSSKTKPL